MFETSYHQTNEGSSEGERRNSSKCALDWRQESVIAHVKEPPFEQKNKILLFERGKANIKTLF